MVFFLRKNQFAKALLLLLVSGVFLCRTSAQQGPMFSQYMFNMLNVNPAYAGNRAVNNVTLLYRNQWIGFEGKPVTAMLSWDKRKEQSNTGYGVQIYNDRLGLMNTSDNHSTLTMGLSGGVMNYNDNFSGMNLWDTGDAAAVSSSLWLPTLGLGGLFFKDEWYIGLSVPSLLRSVPGSRLDIGEYKGPFRTNYQYFLTGGYIFMLSRDWIVKPSSLLKYSSESGLQVDLNGNFWYENKYGLGVSFRTGNALVGMLECQLTPQFRLGVAYDYIISKLGFQNFGAAELLLRYEFETSGGLGVGSPRYY
jgi:type IX secretion system PorP/SprF family membrane protein